MEILQTSSLTVTRAEDWVGRLDHAANNAASVMIDLTGCRSIESGAGWRLGNALRPFAAPDGRCDAIVESPGDFSGWWFLQYTRSGLGPALAAYASRITDASGTDLTDTIRKYYSSRPEHGGSNVKGVYGNLAMQTLVPDEQSFYNRFGGWVGDLMSTKGFEEAELVKKLRVLAWEAVTNIVDHSTKAPLAPRTKTLPALTMRWYRKRPASASPSHARWMAHVDAIADGRPLRGLVDIVVSDDGVGMAARQRLDASVYRGPIEAERSAVAAALAAGNTVKLRAGDAEIRGTAGYGYTYIADAIQALNAWALVRTGRVALECDGTSENGRGFVGRQRTLAYIPGTTIEVTVPVFDSQPELPLS